MSLKRVMMEGAREGSKHTVEINVKYFAAKSLTQT